MVLDHLFDRNVAWAQGKTREDPTYFVRMAEQQSPELLWIGCSDSRVTANDVLGLDPRAVFVQRNIANMVHTSDMNLLAVLEFAVETLAVRHIVICGHYSCGGVARALGDDRSALVDHWLQPLVMLHRKHRGVFEDLAPRARLDRLCELNVQMQLRRAAQTPIVEAAWQRGQELHVHGWIYGVEDGLLREVEPPVASIAARDGLANIDTCAGIPAEPESAVRRQALAAFAADPAECCGCSAAAGR